MEETYRPGEAAVRRYIDNSRWVVISEGDFGPLIDAWRLHASVWSPSSDGLGDMLMRQGLAAAALHLANRPRDEMVGWTLNLAEPPTNVFMTGDARQSNVTGRVFTEGVKTVAHSRLFVQSYRAGREPMESVIEVRGFDLLSIFEQYYQRSEQNPARFFQKENDEFFMVLGMPGVNRQWMAELDLPASLALIDEARLLEERPFRFECGCSPGKMLNALRDIFQADPEELFQGEAGVETSCPRCGRRWWIQRDQFQAEA